MNVNFHNPQRAISNEMTCASGDFTMLQFSKPGDEVTLFLTAEQADMARAIAAIFNGDINAVADRIGDAISRVVELTDEDLAETALFVSCDLVGKSFDEALRERREAEDAA